MLTPVAFVVGSTDAQGQCHSFRNSQRDRRDDGQSIEDLTDRERRQVAEDDPRTTFETVRCMLVRRLAAQASALGAAHGLPRSREVAGRGIRRRVE